MSENFVDDQNFFMDFTDQVHPNDNLSKHICTACYNHLAWMSDSSPNIVPPVNEPPDLGIFANFNQMLEEEDKKMSAEPVYVLPKPIKKESSVEMSPANFDSPPASLSDPTPFHVKQRDLSDQDDNSSFGDAFELKSSGKCGIPFDECDNFPTSSQQLRQHPSPLSRDISCHNCNEKFRKVQLCKSATRDASGSRPRRSENIPGSRRAPRICCGGLPDPGERVPGTPRLGAACVNSRAFAPRKTNVCLRRIRPTNDSQPLSSNQKKSSVFVCEICNANFNRLNLLVKHQLKHKPKSEWKEKCHICDLSFERHALLARHLKTAHAESDQSPWKCRHCGKHMMTKLSLGIHERIHTGAKPYVCEWCGQRFRSRANLLQHHPKHTGIKKHKCEECGKQFSRKSFVTAHMRVHTGERPFSCGICNRKFTQIGDMRRHEKKHEISIKHGRTCYTVIDINKNQSSDSVSTADSDDHLTDSEIALNVKVIQDC
ncbi:unnamed protein product [Bemisia tabaci]|uniref:C2H2-type domain-containing protein n=1 Tax=Bemisia tabaci TaxID=7038 RepID=A0A9P0EZZ3_BEMTA|nr:unnamed protein product [Bemisia tabaci]